MFIVRFQGGLGNQMFEYAFYRALQAKYPGVDVKADVPKADRSEHNGYELEKVFGIKVNEARPHEVALLSDRCPAEMRYAAFYNFLMARSRYVVGVKNSILRQPDYTVHYEEVWGLSPLKSYYLEGVWAHEDYYSHVRDLLLTEFTFPGEYDIVNQDYEREMIGTDSVSVHYRGGDYVRVGANMLDAQYYAEAARRIEDHVKNPRYFIFTDDAQSMKAAGVLQLFGGKSHRVVDANRGQASYRDMRLMSKCRHNIIANSSFSYWAAELNGNPEKIVISSRQAFRPENRHSFTRRSWIQI